jgi:hypothetical protein
LLLDTHMRGRRTAGGGRGSRPGLPPGSTRSLRAGGPIVVLLLVAGLVLGACGTPPRDVATSAGSPATAPAPPAVAPAAAPGGAPTLPTLPPVQSRSPERFDANGCLKTSPTDADCTQRAGQLDASAAGSAPQDWRTLSGFVGSQYTTDVSRNALVVLTDTITITSTSDAAGSSSWTALGLVRNEQARTVAGVAVEATLMDGNGAVLEVVAAESPVRSLRAGEPAPFRLRATAAGVSPGAVAHVTWRATEVAGTADPSARQLEVNTYWTRPYGDERPVHMYLHDDVAGQVPAYLLFGSARADAVIARPHVVLAWLGPTGKVQAVRDVDLADPGGAAAAALAPGSARDFLVAVDDPVDGPIASNAAPMLWGAGR